MSGAVVVSFRLSFFLAALQQRRFGKFVKFHCLQRIDRLCCSSCCSSLLQLLYGWCCSWPPNYIHARSWIEAEAEVEAEAVAVAKAQAEAEAEAVADAEEAVAEAQTEAQAETERPRLQVAGYWFVVIGSWFLWLVKLMKLAEIVKASLLAHFRKI